MNFCPKKFGHDMTDQANLDYCRRIQDSERCKYCMHYINKEKDSPVKTRKNHGNNQGKLF